MKHTINILAVLALLACMSCKEDTLEVYHGDNYVHFTPGADGNIRAEYNFATSGTTAETEVRVPIEIRLWGYLPESDFKCMTAVSEWVTVRRRQELLATDYTLTVTMTGAEDHVVAPSEYTNATVIVRDRITAAPVWWNTTQALGNYSDMKFRVFNIYLGKYLTSLADYTSITFEEEVARFKQWWIEQWAEGNYQYYAEDGSTPLYETIPD